MTAGDADACTASARISNDGGGDDDDDDDDDGEEEEEEDCAVAALTARCTAGVDWER